MSRMLCTAKGSSPHTRGARWPCTRRRPKAGDHPRIRGEHVAHLGTLRDMEGIIPAYAGSTIVADTPQGAQAGSSPHTRGARLPGWRLPIGSRDHPRIRGEHVRGALGGAVAYGIIPAYAGSTTISRLMIRPLRGSSPHTRGALNATGVLIGALGIIPAYAGSTSSLVR